MSLVKVRAPWPGRAARRTAIAAAAADLQRARAGRGLVEDVVAELARRTAELRTQA